MRGRALRLPRDRRAPFARTAPRPGSAPRPDDALLGRHAPDALVHELLDPLALVGLGRVQVALRVDRDAVHAEELAGLPAAVAEAGDLRERLAHDHAHLLVGAVGEEDELLLRILRESDVPRRSRGERLPGEPRLLH